MKTRTLLLLAVACGLAILVAGSVQLLRISDEDEPEVLDIGAASTIGDLELTVDGVERTGDIVAVSVTVGGVEDPDAIGSDFRLVMAGAALEPNPPSDDGDCDGVRLDTRSCTVRFGVADTRGSAMVLVVRRADEQARYELAAGS